MSAKHTLFVNITDSRCGNCGRGADPKERSHRTQLGYHPTREPGCGMTWYYVSSDYVGMPQLEERIRAMRPDLKWVSQERAL